MKYDKELKLIRQIHKITQELRNTGHPSTAWINRKINRLNKLELELLRLQRNKQERVPCE